MATITDHYGISGPVPFANVEVTADNRLYVDPHRIRLRRNTDHFAEDAARSLDSFFDTITGHIVSPTAHGGSAGARSLLRRFVEPWETRLGMSRHGFFGHGGAGAVGDWIFDAFSTDLEALVRVGFLKHVEDLPLFVAGVDRDITSDITTRIIYGSLVDFTTSMVDRYPAFRESGHSVVRCVKQVWDHDTCDWWDTQVSLPVVDGKELLLVPTDWAAPSLLMTSGRFYQTSVMSYVQDERTTYGPNGSVLKFTKKHLMSEPDLVRGRRTNLNTTVRALADGRDLVGSFRSYVHERFEAA